MSETQEVSKVTTLQKLVQQRNVFVAQSEQFAAQFQQAQGAIFACNEMIKQCENDALQEIANKDNQGENVDGKTNGKSAKQASKK